MNMKFVRINKNDIIRELHDNKKLVVCKIDKFGTEEDIFKLFTIDKDITTFKELYEITEDKNISVFKLVIPEKDVVKNNYKMELTVENVRRVYIKQKNSLEETSEIMGVPKGTLNKFICKNNIYKRGKYRK